MNTSYPHTMTTLQGKRDKCCLIYRLEHGDAEKSSDYRKQRASQGQQQCSNPRPLSLNPAFPRYELLLISLVNCRLLPSSTAGGGGGQVALHSQLPTLTAEQGFRPVAPPELVTLHSQLPTGLHWDGAASLTHLKRSTLWGGSLALCKDPLTRIP